MKLFKMVSILLALIFVLSGCNTGNESISGTNENKFTDSLVFELLDNGTYGVKAGTFNEKNLEIPAAYDGKAVTEILPNGFYGIKAIESVTLPSTIEKIGDSAFMGCSSLKNLNIPASVVTIDNFAFKGCSILETVSFAQKE